MEGYQLQNGEVIPYLGYGTGVVNHYTRKPYLWAKQKARLILSSVKHMKINRQLKLDLCAPRLVRQAYEEGIRLFDTGRIYGYSEKTIGKGLKGVPREQYYLVTKFSDLCFQMPAIDGYKQTDVIGHLKKSLKFLQTDYVDLLLIHHPHGPVVEIWGQMEQAYEQGLCKAIGTSNFNVKDFLKLKETQRIAPMVNQGERHPFFLNTEVFDYCRQNQIIFMAHTPTGHFKAQNSSSIQNLAQKYNKTPQQIVLRWHYQCGAVPIISTVNKQHMKESSNIFDFHLQKGEMCSLDSLNDNIRLLDCLNGVDNPNYRFNL